MSAAGFPALGFNPAPGDVATVQREAQRFSAVAQEIGTTVKNLEQVDAGYWKGQAATAFRQHIRTDLTPLLSKLSDAFTQASGSLSKWSKLLDGFQQQARALEQRAQQAGAGVTAAKQALANGKASAGATLTAAQRTAQQKLQDGVTSAVSGAAAIQREAEDLQAEVNRTAQSIAGELQHAGNMAPSPPGWLDSLFHDVTSGWDDTVDWVKNHADAIKLFSDLMSDASAVLQILAIITAPFEPLGAIFEGAALLTGAVALLSALLAKAAGANESWETIGLDALSVLPGIGGAAKAMGGTVKVAEVGAKLVDDGAALERAGEIGSDSVKLADGTVKIFGKSVKIFGKSVKLADSWEITNIGDKSDAVYEKLYQGLRGGQWVGTKGLRLIGTAGDKAFTDTPKVFEFLKTIDQTSWAGRSFDAGVKLLPKLYTIPNGIEKDLKSLGTSFGSAVNG